MIEPLAEEVLNFRSSKAYNFFINAKDTHKSWQSAQVILFSTTLKLLRVFLAKNEPDVESFLNWVTFNHNPTIKLIGELTLNYVLAIYFFKIESLLKITHSFLSQ